MATFNGEKFIEAQINSLLNQSFKNWQLYIRDDLSADNTCNILQKYSDGHFNIHIVRDQKINVGSTQNFSKLIQAVKHLDGYVMFCDQDDYWLKDKIEVSLDEMIEVEKKFSSAMDR